MGPYRVASDMTPLDMHRWSLEGDTTGSNQIFQLQVRPAFKIRVLDEWDADGCKTIPVLIMSMVGGLGRL